MASLQTAQEIKQCQQFITPGSDRLHVHLSDGGKLLWEHSSEKALFSQALRSFSRLSYFHTFQISSSKPNKLLFIPTSWALSQRLRSY